MGLEIDKYADLVWKDEKGQWHREKGPAVIYTDGCIEHIFKGKFHRLDGPAIIWPDGNKEYRIHGIEYTKKDYCVKVKEL